MWLPTKLQVDAAVRHAITAAGTMIMLLGLQAKGFDVAQITAMIQAAGASVNDIVVLIGTASTVYAAIKASSTASPKAQAQAVAATGAVVVASPEIAAATPETNIVSKDDVKVVPR